MVQVLCFLSGRSLFAALGRTRGGLEAAGPANDSAWLAPKN